MVDMAEEAHIGSNPQQQAMIEKMRNELKWSTDCRSFKSVIRRYSATLRELPLSADTHDEPCVLYAKLQQVRKSLVYLHLKFEALAIVYVFCRSLRGI